jgi:GTP-binding protein HflX
MVKSQSNPEKPSEKLHDTAPKETQRALLVATYNGAAQRPICEEHIEELSLLAKTFGVEVVGKFPCQNRKCDAATFITSGKLEELRLLADEVNANLVIIDEEITPSQQRNLEIVFKRPVMDRTEVILGVFAQRAQTKEAQLQIELAKIKYQTPRLKRLWSHLSRQHGSGGGGGGGGGYTKGEGEKQIELDKRILQSKIDQLQKELEDVENVRETQRQARIKSEIPVFAIIGYTNAGKSTLLNALTNAGVFVEDKLFATLDTTTRKFKLPNNQDILLIDTVGFIRKLPHLLVAAFKSTLEEAIQADILIHLIDSSHPMAEEQLQASLEVLKELGAEKKPILTVLNKIDKPEAAANAPNLRHKFPNTVEISAAEKMGFEQLQEAMIREFSKFRKTVKLKVPQSEYHIVSQAMKLGNVLHQEFEENDVILRVDLPAAIADKLAKYVVS